MSLHMLMHLRVLNPLHLRVPMPLQVQVPGAIVVMHPGAAKPEGGSGWAVFPV
jgi:hypothetical protein